MSENPRIGTGAHGNPNAMTNEAGDWFHPDNPNDAVWFAEEHEAWFATPDQSTMHMDTAVILWARRSPQEFSRTVASILGLRPGVMP